MKKSQLDQYLLGGREEDRYLFHLVQRSRVMVLLGALLMSIVLNPWIAHSPLLSHLTKVALIVAAVYTAADNKHHLGLGLGLGIPAVILLVSAQVSGNRDLGWVAYLLALFLYVHVIRLFLQHIFLAEIVTLDTIGMALCTYVLLGALWTLFYTPVLVLDPGSFIFNGPHPQGEEIAAVLTYFSYVTLTTLGYGDIVPVSEIARALAILEALTGTLFLAVLISRLVGTYSSSRKKKIGNSEVDSPG